MTSTSTWSSSEDEPGGGGEGEGGGAGEPGAADSVGVVGDTGDDPLQAAIDIPVASSQVATRQPGGRSHLATDRHNFFTVKHSL